MINYEEKVLLINKIQNIRFALDNQLYIDDQQKQELEADLVDFNDDFIDLFEVRYANERSN